MLTNTLFSKNVRMLKHYLENLTDNLIVVTDKKFKIIGCNRGFLKNLNLEEKPIGENLWDIISIEKNFGNKEVYFRSAKFEIKNISLSFKNSNGSSVSLKGFMGYTGGHYLFIFENYIVNDNTIIEKMYRLNVEMSNLTRELNKKNIQLKKNNEEITKLMNTDVLTKLWNRRYFYKRLKEEISLAKRNDNHLLGIIMFDLDEFKKINDTYGHDIGDQVLVRFSELLVQNIREEDIAARFGGEEFIILNISQGKEESLKLAERIKSELKNLKIEGVSTPITSSMGISQLNRWDTIDSLIKRADEALYRAKHNGRDEICLENI